MNWYETIHFCKIILKHMKLMKKLNKRLRVIIIFSLYEKIFRKIPLVINKILIDRNLT